MLKFIGRAAAATILAGAVVVPMSGVAQAHDGGHYNNWRHHNNCRSYGGYHDLPARGWGYSWNNGWDNALWGHSGFWGHSSSGRWGCDNHRWHGGHHHNNYNHHHGWGI
ncbi:hypothetical protein [Streptomyces varsoviensis]|uniref:hypothetical protein n=1 Tax=Streptomyces varsoviensis TaxID=67373 RepID=UPI0004C89A5B|nr:hypothetical protein [Streptomyces varsoviensis]